MVKFNSRGRNDTLNVLNDDSGFTVLQRTKHTGSYFNTDNVISLLR